MNYKIITDEKKLLDFIDWLPDLQPHETYVVNLFARNKYCKDICHINSDKAQMKRFATSKEWMFRKIKALEIELGNYWQQKIPIPQEALALYVTVNPRSQVKAAKNLLIKLAKLIGEPYNSYNVSSEALSELQKAKSRSLYTDFDIDFDPFFAGMDVAERQELRKGVEYVADQLSSTINKEAVTILRTRGGVHVLIEHAKVDPKYSKTWYNDISSLAGVDIKGDSMIPVPGCTQGNFTPHFINHHENSDCVCSATGSKCLCNTDYPA